MVGLLYYSADGHCPPAHLKLSKFRGAWTPTMRVLNCSQTMEILSWQPPRPIWQANQVELSQIPVLRQPFFLRVKGRGENPLPEYIDGAMFEPKAYNIDLQQIWKTTPTEQDKRTTWEQAFGTRTQRLCGQGSSGSTSIGPRLLYSGSLWNIFFYF